MAKIFLYVLCVLLVLNFGFKAVNYLLYNKIQGKVIELRQLTSISHSRGKGAFVSETIAPVIVYTVKDTTYTGCESKWGGVFVPAVGSNITLMYDKDVSHPDINTFFNYWLTVANIITGFFIAVAFIIIFELIKSIKKS